jgi:ketosteroid isomerase-like protein
MGQEDVEVVKAFDSLARGDFEASIGASAHETEWDDSEVRPDGGVRRRRRAVWDRVRTWMGTFGEYSFELEQVLDAGEEVVVLYRDHGRGKGSGVEIEHHWGS